MTPQFRLTAFPARAKSAGYKSQKTLLPDLCETMRSPHDSQQSRSATSGTTILAMRM